MSPLYPALRTNLPVPYMSYPSFPFLPGTPLYPSHTHIRAYHDRFARRFKLHNHIFSNHTIEVAAWVGTSEKGFWNVTVSDEKGLVSHRSFGHLVVASGNYHHPNIPTWKNQDVWLESGPSTRPRRRLVHSVYYRKPEVFTNQTVLIIGHGVSARDIASQIVTRANGVRRLYLYFHYNL